VNRLATWTLSAEAWTTQRLDRLLARTLHDAQPIAEQTVVRKMEGLVESDRIERVEGCEVRVEDAQRLGGHVNGTGCGLHA
jgi:hypothetical protein